MFNKTKSQHLRALFLLFCFLNTRSNFPLQQLKLSQLLLTFYFNLSAMAAILKKRNKKYTTLKCAHASVVQTKSPSTDVDAAAVVVAAVVAYCVYPLKEKLS